MTYTLFENRDVRCAADVGRMAELGRFATEIVVYGTAVQEMDGRIFYRATEHEEKLYQHIQLQRVQEEYYTPIIMQREREKIPFELHEAYALDRKYALLRYMKHVYEDSGYFELLQPFFLRESNNHAFPLLNRYRGELEGYFNDTALQTFWGLVRIAYESKVLSAEGYGALDSWYQKIRKQMRDDPVVENNIGRTFYGFGYLNEQGVQQYVIDTQLMPVVHLREEKIMQGFLTGAIMQKTYWFQQFHQMPEVRKAYQQWLQEAQDTAYFSYLHTIKSLPGIIERNEAIATLEKLKKYAEAKNAVAYYFSIWNKK